MNAYQSIQQFRLTGPSPEIDAFWETEIARSWWKKYLFTWEQPKADAIKSTLRELHRLAGKWDGINEKNASSYLSAVIHNSLFHFVTSIRHLHHVSDSVH